MSSRWKREQRIKKQRRAWYKVMNRDFDMRNMYFAIVINNVVFTCGSIPLYEEKELPSCKLGYYIDKTNKIGGDLYIGEQSGKAMDLPPRGDLIFGRTWEEIQDIQLGRHQVSKYVSLILKENLKLVHSANHLLCKKEYK